MQGPACVARIAAHAIGTKKGRRTMKDVSTMSATPAICAHRCSRIPFIRSTLDRPDAARYPVGLHKWSVADQAWLFRCGKNRASWTRCAGRKFNNYDLKQLVTELGPAWYRLCVSTP